MNHGCNTQNHEDIKNVAAENIGYCQVRLMPEGRDNIYRELRHGCTETDNNSPDYNFRYFETPGKRRTAVNQQIGPLNGKDQPQ